MLPSTWTMIGQVFTLLILLGFIALMVLIPVALYRISKNTQRLADLKEREPEGRTSSPPGSD